MTEGDALVPGLQLPTEVRDGLVHARDKAFLDSEEEEGAQHGFRRRIPIAQLGLVAPGLDDIAVFDNASPAAEAFGQSIKVRGVHAHFSGSPVFPVRPWKMCFCARRGQAEEPTCEDKQEPVHQANLP